MEGIDYLGPQGGALALAFAAGASFTGGLLWGFIVAPLKRERDAANELARASGKELRDKLVSDIQWWQAQASAKGGPVR